MTTPAEYEMHERLAQRFHEAYERLAPEFGYKTREASAVPWEQVPEANRKLMTAVCLTITADVADSAVVVLGQLYVKRADVERALDAELTRSPLARSVTQVIAGLRSDLFPEDA